MKQRREAPPLLTGVASFWTLTENANLTPLDVLDISRSVTAREIAGGSGSTSFSCFARKETDLAQTDRLGCRPSLYLPHPSLRLFS